MRTSAWWISIGVEAGEGAFDAAQAAGIGDDGVVDAAVGIGVEEDAAPVAGDARLCGIVATSWLSLWVSNVPPAP